VAFDCTLYFTVANFQFGVRRPELPAPCLLPEAATGLAQNAIIESLETSWVRPGNFIFIFLVHEESPSFFTPRFVLANVQLKVASST
jgi:hypothetical protein